MRDGGSRSRPSGARRRGGAPASPLGRRAAPLRCGWSLLELLAALTLLVALGAIALPNLTGRLEERAFETAAEVAQSQLILARAHAQTTGRPVEVRYAGDPPRVEARVFTLDDDAGDGRSGRRFAAAARRRTAAAADTAQEPARVGRVEPEGSRKSADRPGRGDRSAQDSPADADADADTDTDTDTDTLAPALDALASDGGLIPASWAYRLLPHGVRFRLTAPPSADAAGGYPGNPDFRLDLAEDDLEAEDAGPIRLALFLPDGSALLAGGVYLTGGEDLVGRLEVNPWTGLPRFERIDPSSSASSPRPSAALRVESSSPVSEGGQ